MWNLCGVILGYVIRNYLVLNIGVPRFRGLGVSSEFGVRRVGLEFSNVDFGLGVGCPSGAIPVLWGVPFWFWGSIPENRTWSGGGWCNWAMAGWVFGLWGRSLVAWCRVGLVGLAGLGVMGASFV